MSERSPGRRRPYNPYREPDDDDQVLVFRDVPPIEWETTPRALDPNSWEAGLEAARRRSAELSRMPYKDYLRTEEWKRLRVLVVARAGNQCERCGKTGRRTNVHHLTYERRGFEMLSDLILLCEPCHEAEHGIVAS